MYMHSEMHAGSSCLGFQGLEAAVYIYMRASVCKQRTIAVASRMVKLQKKAVGVQRACMGRSLGANATQNLQL